MDEHIFFLDLDIYVGDIGKIWTAEHTVLTATIIMIHLQELLPDTPTTCIITDAKPQKITSVGCDDKYKIGIHLFVPDVFVDVATHLKIRHYLLVVISASSPEHIGCPLPVGGDIDKDAGFPLINPWSDVIDKAVCIKPKLRMLPATKASNCFHTKEEKAELKCGPKKHKINLGRKYRVIDIIKYNPVDDEFQRDASMYEKYTNLDEDPAEVAKHAKLVSPQPP